MFHGTYYDIEIKSNDDPNTPDVIMYNKDGSVHEKVWEDAEKIIKQITYKDDKIVKQLEYINENNNEYYRITYYDNDMTEIHYTDLDHKLHREDGPAKLKYHNTTLMYECWYTHGKSNRDVGPARTKYHPNGKIASVEFIHDSVVYNDFGPSHIEYDIDGNITFEYWATSDGLRKDHIVATKTKNNTKIVSRRYFDDQVGWFDINDHFVNNQFVKKQRVYHEPKKVDNIRTITYDTDGYIIDIERI